MSEVKYDLQLIYLFFNLKISIDIFKCMQYNKNIKIKGCDNVPLTMGEKIKIILKRRNMTLAQLAEKTGQSRQNLSNKLSRDNFTEKELYVIAAALDCSFHAAFTMNDTGEQL